MTRWVGLGELSLVHVEEHMVYDSDHGLGLGEHGLALGMSQG